MGSVLSTAHCEVKEECQKEEHNKKSLGTPGILTPTCFSKATDSPKRNESKHALKHLETLSFVCEVFSGKAECIQLCTSIFPPAILTFTAMKTFCVPLINASWLYWLTVHQLWSSFYFYPFSHKLFINFPVTCSSMGTERGTVNMRKILFIVIGMKTVPVPQFPWAVNVRNWRITAPCRFLKGISDCPLTLLIDLPHLEHGCCALRKNALFAVAVMWKKEQGSSVPIYSCTKLKWLLWSHSFILSTQWHSTQFNSFHFDTNYFLLLFPITLCC